MRRGAVNDPEGELVPANFDVDAELRFLIDAEMRKRGKAFAAEVVEQFLATMGMFPVASLVELNDGSVAVVLEQNPNNVLRPKVLLLLDENRTPLDQPTLLLSSPPLPLFFACALVLLGCVLLKNVPSA